MKIEGLSHATILSIMSEVGPDGFRKFETAKQFASWLRLAPNNKISGGKVLSKKVPKGSNRLKIALRNAANAIRVFIYVFIHHRQFSSISYIYLFTQLRKSYSLLS